jgi:hypothetical protein
MAIKFGSVSGKAKKAANYYQYKDGDNELRLVGDLLPRYVYWLKSDDGSNHGIECLGFDRDAETFKNKETDWVRKLFPDKKCSWAYLVQALDSDNKLVMVPLKKKLFEQIKTAAEDLGDPTNIETGWAVKFKKVKTGSQAFNVEYTLQVLKCKPSPLTPEQREAIKDLKPIDELVPRPTPAEQKEYIEANLMGTGAKEEAPAELGGGSEAVEDIPC